jgi:hypothetical protein
VQIDSTSEVNFELVTVPEFTATYLTTQHLGTVLLSRSADLTAHRRVLPDQQPERGTVPELGHA